MLFFILKSRNFQKTRDFQKNLKNPGFSKKTRDFQKTEKPGIFKKTRDFQKT